MWSLSVYTVKHTMWYVVSFYISSSYKNQNLRKTQKPQMAMSELKVTFEFVVNLITRLGGCFQPYNVKQRRLSFSDSIMSK